MEGSQFVELYENPEITDFEKYQLLDYCKVFYDCDPYKKAKIV